MNSDPPRDAGGSRALWWEVTLLLALALLLRLIHLDHTPHFDELYHILAGRSWIVEGDLCIAECELPYSRGALFTYLVAGSFKLFGVSVAAARVPTLIAGSLWVGVVFWWVYRTAGTTAAWVAGVLFCFAPGAIYLSQFSRFYALQGLFLTLGLFGVYLVLTEDHSRRGTAVIGGASVVALLAAYHFQVTTFIGLAGLGLWAALFPLPRVARRYVDRRWFGWAVGGVAVVLAAAIIGAWQTGLIEELWRRYRWTNLMRAGDAENVRFYHAWFLSQYPALYAFLPVAVIIAFARRPRPTAFCAITFATAFVVHSFGGTKGMRFIYWSIPFFFILWGIAAAEILGFVRERAEAAVRWISPSALSGRAMRMTGGLSLGAALLFLVGTTDAYNTTLKMLTLSDAEWPVSKPWYRGQSNWSAARSVLQPLADESEVVLASASPKALFFLGRSDASISANQLFQSGNDATPEFTDDWRLGRPIISEPASVRRIWRCASSGLVVAEEGHWERSSAVPRATAGFISSRMEPVPLDPDWGLLAFRWERPESAEEACSPFPRPRIGDSPPTTGDGSGQDLKRMR